MTFKIKHLIGALFQLGLFFIVALSSERPSLILDDSSGKLNKVELAEKNSALSSISSSLSSSVGNLRASFKKLADDYAGGAESFSFADKYNGTTVSLIVIASMQRSSSTYLNFGVLGSMPCSLAMNEMLNVNPKQSGDAWGTEGKEMFGDKRDMRKTLDPNQLATFVLKVAQRRCHEKLEKEGLIDQCGNHCWVSYKHFEQHLAIWQHQMVWGSMLRQLQSQGQTFGMAVLERNIDDRWKSHYYAKETGDWNVKGKAEHKEKIAATEIPKVAYDFKKTHEQYYSLIRGYYTMTNKHLKQLGLPPFPVLELDFDAVTSSKEKTQKLIKKEMMKNY